MNQGQNPYLVPDNVNLIVNCIRERLPQSPFDFQAVVNFMQQVAGSYPLPPGTDPKQYLNQLNNFTLQSLVNSVQGPTQQTNLMPSNHNSSMELSANAQEMSRLVDQLKRERNYNQSLQASVPPQRGFTDPQEPREAVLNNVKNKIQVEHDLNKSLGGAIKSVNLHEVLGSVPPPNFNNNPKETNNPTGLTDNLKAAELDLSFNASQFQPNGYVLPPNQTKYLSLDFRTDVVDIEGQEYVFKFSEIKAVRALELVSVSLLRQPVLENQPYLYISIKSREADLNQLCLTGRKKCRFFGKLIPQAPTFNQFLNYRLETNLEGPGCQIHSPGCQGPVNLPVNWNLQQLQIGFFDYQARPLDLKTLPIQRLIRLNQNQIQIETPEAHHLRVGDNLLMTQKREYSFQAHLNRVLEVPNQSQIITQYQSNNLNHLKIARPQVPGHLTLKLYS